MDKLFGTSKPKVVAPKVDINAPTLTETSAKVSIKTLTFNVDGPAWQGDLGQDRRVQCPTERLEEKNVYSKRDDLEFL